MRSAITHIGLFFVLVFSSCCSEIDKNMVLIKGDSFVPSYMDHAIELSDYYIGRHEVTQAEWTKVMGSNPSFFKGADLPVENVSWYDCVEYCNRRSLKEGLQPCYTIIKDQTDHVNFNEIDSVKWTVLFDTTANGYRLPTEAEWEFAASCAGRGYIFSGSDKVDEVAWYWRNSGKSFLEGDWSWSAIEENKGRTHRVGRKQSNSCGLYDMSGNVREWCWDWYEDKQLLQGYARVWRGGGWVGGEHACAVRYRGLFEASGMGPDQGFRLVRSAF